MMAPALTETFALIVLLLGASLLAGCSTAPSYHDVGFDGTVTVQDNSFRMVGEVDVGSGAQPDATFTNISLVFYNSDKEVLKKFEIGSLSTTGPDAQREQELNVTTETIPAYVVIESNSFWSTEADVQIVAYRLEDGEYEKYIRHAKSQKFPKK